MGDHYDKHREADYDRQAEREKYQSERDRGVSKYQSQRERLYTALEVLGNGDSEKGEKLLFEIAGRLRHARTKHPFFADDMIHGAKVVADEFTEFVQAVNGEGLPRSKDEGLDVIATEIRFLNEEWEQ